MKSEEEIKKYQQRFHSLLDISKVPMIKMAFAGIDFIDGLLEKRDRLRSEKKFDEADEIKLLVESYDIEVCDTADGTTWSVRFLNEKATKRFISWLESQTERNARLNHFNKKETQNVESEE